ncbi:DUF4271 domain-containing protein [Tenacibaculum piscium]|uniref:DUF4271 domain-containing protein n=1 Tax=Tenacibaculum piscium TaxID=1458515 RepID=UPI00374D2E97
MQAIERIIPDNNWITLVFIVAIILLAILKLIKPKKLRGYAYAFFTTGFIKNKITDSASFLTPFYGFLFLFSTIILSLFLFLILMPSIYADTFFNYLMLLCFVSVYFIVRFFIDVILAKIMQSSQDLQYFSATKIGYLNSLSLWLFPVLIVYQYGFTNRLFLVSFFGILFIFRAFLILKNNKKIVIHKLFYFILYFCTLEIAPLLIVYKITTT